MSEVDSTIEAVDAADVEQSVEPDGAVNPDIRCVIIDCSSMMFIDYVGTTTIHQV